MENALALFRQVYEQHRDIQICIAELKRVGFSQIETIKVLMEVLTIDVVKADEMVRSSIAWSN
ncbi:hypothetical protein [Spirosoma koreense]